MKRLTIWIELIVAGHLCASIFCIAQASPTTSAGSQSSTSSPTSAPTTLTVVPEDFSKLKLGSGFMLAVVVYDAPELSGTFRVDRSGNVTLPLVGSLHVADLTTLEAQHQLESVYLSREILNHPQVTISVVEYAPYIVSVVGEVGRPGQIQLLAPRSLLNVITDAGGLTEVAGHVVELEHTVAGVRTTDRYSYSRGADGDDIRDVTVNAGDTITVPRAGIIYVLGAVMRPGGYVMQESGQLNVAQALALALGTSRDARVGGIRVVRRSPDGTLVDFPISYKAIANGKQVPLSLLAQDIVYVPVSKIKTFFTSSSGIAGSAASTAIVATK